MNRSMLIGCMLGVVALGLLTSTAGASLVVQVKAQSVTGAGTVVSATSVTGLQTGDVVHFQAYAVVLGQTDTAVEGITSLYGGVVKTNVVGAIHGTFSNLSLQGGFDGGSGATAGTNGFDLNGDGDLDIGSLTTGSPNGWIFGRPASPYTAYGNPSYSWYCYSFDYTVGSADSNATATINWLVRNGNTTAVWKEDNTNKNPGTATYASGTPVSLAMEVIPEPATLALLGLGGALLLNRRKKS